MDKVKEPKLPKVKYGDLTAREQAIVEARRYLNKHAAHKPTPAYLVISGLLSLFDTEELLRTYDKAKIT